MQLRLLARILGVLVVGFCSVLVGVGPASADKECHLNPDGSYQCTESDSDTDPGSPGDDGSGDESTPVEPTCELFGDYTYCIGEKACRNLDWHPPYKLPEGKKPSPDSEPMVRECRTRGFIGPVAVEIYWSGGPEDVPQPPSLQQQSRTAIGELDLSMPALRTSPEGRTLVNFPTWFWLEDAAEEQTGSSAFGLVAIATVQELRIDPGDGSEAFSCPWVTSSRQAREKCTFGYTRASYDGAASWEGKPAHLASASAEWTLRFEMNGNPVTIPGAPATLEGPASTTPIRVDEVQTLVRRAN